MTTTFLLIRHTEHAMGMQTVAARTPDVPLSEGGRRHAAALAERLARLPIAAVYTSPIQRARETAAPLAERLGLTPRVDEGLTEIDFGRWTGRTIDSLRSEPAWDPWNRFRSGTPAPGGETMLAAQARFADTMIRLRRAHPGQTVALVSHADPIRAALAHWLAIPLDLILRVQVDLGSVSVVHLSEDGVGVECVNHVGELGAGEER